MSLLLLFGPHSPQYTLSSVTCATATLTARTPDTATLSTRADATTTITPR